MDFDEITKILNMMREHELSEFELERDNFKLRIRKQAGGHWVAAPPYPQPGQMAVPPAALPGVPPAATPSTPELPETDEEMELAVVKSPIVGTFYRAAEPGAKPFTEVGEMVTKSTPRSTARW
jgi:acetyl-CoA carboxylase biotin carboxyl carrier protein